MSGGSLTIRRLPVDDAGELVHRPHRVLRHRLGRRLRCRRRHAGLGLGPRHGGALLEPLHQTLDVDVGVPDLEIRHGGHLAHDLAVALAEADDPLQPVALGEPEVARRHHDARGQSLDVPLPRTGQRLVEVVAVEDQLPFGRAEDAEVREMRVAADLCCQPRTRRGGQVRRHHERGAAEEGERRDEHAPVADGDELGDPARGLALQEGDGVGPVRAGLEDLVAVTRHLDPGLLSLGLAIYLAEVWHDARRHVRQRDHLVNSHRRPPPLDARPAPTR